MLLCVPLQAAQTAQSARLTQAPPSARPGLDYHAAMGAIRTALAKLGYPAVVISEGANTMDMARCVCL